MIRACQPGDEQAVRRISFETALYGNPIARYMPDEELISEALVGYYIRFEPGLLLVAEENGRVVGYTTGCRNTRLYKQRYERHVLPSLLRLFIRHRHWRRGHSWRLVFRIVQTAHLVTKLQEHVDRDFPAHCHCNILPSHQGKGLGAQLMAQLLAELKKEQVKGIHLSTATDAGKAFFTRMGFQPICQYQLPPLWDQAARELWVMARSINGHDARPS
ncbi:MAG: GNAT family N-acetyltransferase [Lentisphaerota bacterium]